MGCLPILDCEHVTFGDGSDTPSRLGISEQFFGLGHSVSLPLPQPVHVRVILGGPGYLRSS